MLSKMEQQVIKIVESTINYKINYKIALFFVSHVSQIVLPKAVNPLDKLSRM